MDKIMQALRHAQPEALKNAVAIGVVMSENAEIRHYRHAGPRMALESGLAKWNI